MKTYKKYFILGLGLFLWQCSLFKDTEAFKKAQSFLEENSFVAENLGKIESYGNPMGSYNLNGGTGSASFDFSITAEKGKAQVQLELSKDLSGWTVVKAQLKPENSDQVVNLLTQGTSLAFYHSYFGIEPWGAPRTPATYKEGETLYFHGRARGFKTDESKTVYVQMDAELTYPDGTKERQDGVLKGPTESPEGTLDVYYYFPITKDILTPNSKPYSIKLILTDLPTQKKIEVSGEFLVSGS